MALVAYDNSDSSEFEEDDQETTNTVTHKKVEVSAELSKEIRATQREEHNDETAPSIEGTLFNFLPQPSSKKPQVIEEDDEFLHKKESSNVLKPKAKITVPSLNDFKDVESSVPAPKPRMGNGKKSGLLSILPQPRNGVKATTNSFLPYALTQKSNNANVKKKETLPTPVKKPKIDSKHIINDYSDDSDNDGVENDFFSIHKPMEIPVEDVPLNIDQNIERPNKPSSEVKPFNIESYFKPNTVENQVEPTDSHHPNSMEYADVASSYNNDYIAMESNSNETVLDEEAILKLCGARGKRRKEDIEIVDVNQQEILADARAMLFKGLMDDTTKRVSVSKKKGNEPTSQQKRKHQITYLAHQAKANEAELQNQWANNRMSKRQTQSKYGF